MPNKTAVTLFSGGGLADIGLKTAGFEIVGAVEREPAIADVYRANHGDHVVVGSVFDVDYRQWAGADLLHASPPCFVAGTLVLTERGLIPIEEVVVGDRVLTHKGRYRSVTNVWTKESETVILKGFGHHGIETTADHPFYSMPVSFKYPGKDATGKRPPKQTTFHDPEWVKAEDMLDRYWLTPAKYPSSIIPPIVYPFKWNKQLPSFDKSLMWIVGYWVGNGWMRIRAKNGEVTVCVQKNSQKEKKVVSILKDCGINFSFCEKRTANCYTINSKPFAFWLEEHFSKGAKNKTIPSWMYGIDRSLREAFIDGYLFADGHKEAEYANTWRFSTVSRNLAIGIKLLANSMGVSCTLRRIKNPSSTTTIEGRTVNVQPCYYEGEITAESRYYHFVGDYGLGKVKGITRSEETKQVYDLEVEEDHSFIADGLVVHNCQAYSLARNKNLPPHADNDAGYAVIRAIDEIDPKWITIENVEGYRKSKVYNDIVAHLYSRGYWVVDKLVNAKYHGVPQSRKRLIMVASKTGIYQFPPHEPIIGWYSAIADLLPDCPDTHLADWQRKRLDRVFGTCLINEDSKLKSGIPTDYPAPTVMTTGSGGAMRAVLVGGGSNYGKILARDDSCFTITSTGSGSERVVLVDNFACNLIDADDPSHTLGAKGWGAPKALLPRAGARKQSFRPIAENEPSPTLKATASWGGSHVFDVMDGVTIKKLTPRCLARLMSVPDDYLLPDKVGLAVKVLGNGVPCRMMERIAGNLE